MDDTLDATPDTEEPVPIVVVGSSAGGFNALVELLDNLDEPGTVAWLFVPHLDPDRESQLVSLLGTHVSAPVVEVEPGTPIERGHMYVRPPGRDVNIRNGVWATSGSEEAAGNRGVIDRAMRSLAEAQGDRVIGALLSGALSDGVRGLQEIRAAGGFSIVQDPDTAEFRQLPENAVEAGAADFVLRPAAMGAQIAELADQMAAGVHRPELDQEEESARPDEEGHVRTILHEVQRRADLDFTQYKRTTIMRRIHRRMLANSVDSLDAYKEIVTRDADEAHRLGQEMLIHVTRFFRDDEAFEAMRSQVVPHLVEHHDDQQPLRIWVIGCATGEEAYSLAMVAHEAIAEANADIQVQVFATDISQRAIDQARTAAYPASIADDVSEERLARFFVKGTDSYTVNKSIRSSCIFSVHDVTSDPPFSNMDLVSCRNLLIYMDPPLQRQVLAVIHYALRSEGRLFLGTSESVGVSSERFEVLSDLPGVFRRRDVRLPTPTQATGWAARQKGGRPESGVAPRMNVEDIQYEAQRLLLETHGPAAIVVNRDLDVLYCQGDVEPYVRMRQGTTGLGLHKVADEGLVGHVRALVTEAQRTGASASRRVRTDTDGVRRFVVEVLPLRAEGERPAYLVVFMGPDESQAAAERADRAGRRSGGFLWRLFHPDRAHGEAEEEIDALKQELSSTREYLQSVIEDYEVTMEELRSANEEALSTNEELQSTNEELETAKEELQSTNEELVTVNDELTHRSREVHRVNNDLNNLIQSIDVPIIILGPELNIRRTTPAAEHILAVRSSDVGRPLADLNVPLVVDDLPRRLARVMETLQETTLEVQHRHEGIFLLKIRPYRTDDQRIDGLVLVLTPV